MPARRAALVLAAGMPCLAPAQQVELLPSAVSRCLQPVAAERLPEYPFAAWKNGEKGRVTVELEFTIADGRPGVDVLAREGPDSLVDAVRSHVRSWRVPCLDPAEAPARLRIEFVFQPDDRKVIGSGVLDAADAARTEQLACVRHLRGNKAPEYPTEALRRQVQGRVLAKLRFAATDQPPVAEVHARPSAELLADAVRRWVAGYRMPCLQGPPVEALWAFTWRFEGEVFGFKPLELRQLLSLVPEVVTQGLAADTTAMGCPFDLRLHYRQPFLPNGVAELGVSNPARQPIIDWLRSARLELPSRTADAVFGDFTTVTVPCLKIDIKPKEKS